MSEGMLNGFGLDELYRNRCDVMLDIETLATTPDAVVVCISAVAFEPMTGKILSEFSDTIDPGLAKKMGFRVDPDTMEFWDGLPDDARAQLLGTKQPREVMIYFLDWLAGLKDKYGELMVWGNGADFDPVILEEQMHRMEYPIPWGPKRKRCYRTLLDEVGPFIGFDRAAVEFDGTPHVAIDDARHQVKCLTLFLNKLVAELWGE